MDIELLSEVDYMSEGFNCKDMSNAFDTILLSNTGACGVS